MDWLNEPVEQATPNQRRALYRFVVGVEDDRVRDLIRCLSKVEAAAVLDAFIAADERSRAAGAQDQPQAAPEAERGVGDGWTAERPFHGDDAPEGTP